MEVAVEGMVPILVVLHIECRVPVPAKFFRLLNAHQTVEQRDREVRGQVGGIAERLPPPPSASVFVLFYQES